MRTLIKQLYSLYQRYFLVCLCSCSLTGCFRPYEKPLPYSLRQTDLTKNVERVFATDVVSVGEIAGEAWWMFFQDPQLSGMIELSLISHPDIKSAEFRINRACEQARVVRSALLPHLFGVVEVERKKISKLGQGFVPGFPDLFTETTLGLATARYELDIWQKNRSLYQASLGEIQATRADLEQAKLILSTTIAAVYFDLQMQLARQQVTGDRLSARQELYNLHKQQFDLGIISEFRLYQVDSEVQLLKDLLLQIQADVALDHHALAALIGNTVGLSYENISPSAEFNTPFPLPSTLPIDLLVRRPDITAQIWRVEAACFDIKAARANFFPRIDLMGWLGFQSIKIAKLFRGDTLIALADGVATLPIFVAGKLQGELGVAQENLGIAIEDYNQTVLDAVQEVSDALTHLMSADERKKSLEMAIQDATHLYSLTDQKYQHALSTKLTVLNALENLLIQKDLAIQIQLDRFEAAVELIRAIGGGYYDCRYL